MSIRLRVTDNFFLSLALVLNGTNNYRAVLYLT